MINNVRAKILAIDPGTKNMGVAFLDNGALLYSGVKVIRNRRSPHEIIQTCRKIILRLIKDYQPQMLVVEKTFFANNRNSALLNVLFDEIMNIAKRKKLPIICFAPSTMKKAICGNGLATKEDVARVVIARYPELKVYLTQDRKWKAAFHYNMFDAVALGIMLAGRKSRKKP
ncbi:MAG TPA: crossover junction endodeoxyribonuclease RuvC [Smithella sp.]|nr:crossover junction endodeoxyribonuclease RuvC [Smithella sp.]